VQSLTDWAGEEQDSLLLLVPVLAFLEACIGIGLLVSGAILLTTCVLLYSLAPETVMTMLALAFAGALAGDHSGYFVGFMSKGRFAGAGSAIDSGSKFERASRLLKRSLPLAICVGRLSPPLRSLMPLAAGLSGMKPAQFLFYNLLACTIWVTGLAVMVIMLSGIDL
jgi:membrane-associated protein